MFEDIGGNSFKAINERSTKATYTMEKFLMVLVKRVTSAPVLTVILIMDVIASIAVTAYGGLGLLPPFGNYNDLYINIVIPGMFIPFCGGIAFLLKGLFSLLERKLRERGKSEILKGVMMIGVAFLLFIIQMFAWGLAFQGG